MAHILIVDDSGMSRRMMRKILETDGHAVREAADGPAALEAYALERPDLVMLDLTMEGMDGHAVLDALRKFDPLARVLVASADVQSSTRDIVLEQGAVGILTKPFVGDTVRQTVRQALGGSSI